MMQKLSVSCVRKPVHCFGMVFSKDLQNGMGNLFLCGIGTIMGDVLVHHGPEPFNWI